MASDAGHDDGFRDSAPVTLQEFARAMAAMGLSSVDHTLRSAPRPRPSGVTSLPVDVAAVLSAYGRDQPLFCVGLTRAAGTNALAVLMQRWVAWRGAGRVVALYADGVVGHSHDAPTAGPPVATELRAALAPFGVDVLYCSMGLCDDGSTPPGKSSETVSHQRSMMERMCMLLGS